MCLRARPDRSSSTVDQPRDGRHRRPAQSPFYRSHVGEANVVAKMREVVPPSGGEGNGGVIEPQGRLRPRQLCRHGLHSGRTDGAGPPKRRTSPTGPIRFRSYLIVKDKLTCPADRAEAACQALEQEYSDATAMRGDGLRLDWPDRWVQVRASNTEPILRVIAEAPDESRAVTLCREAMSAVRAAVS